MKNPPLGKGELGGGIGGEEYLRRVDLQLALLLIEWCVIQEQERVRYERMRRRRAGFDDSKFCFLSSLSTSGSE